MKENIINWSTTLTLRCADGCGAGSGDGGGALFLIQCHILWSWKTAPSVTHFIWMCSDVAPALVCMALHYRRFVSASRVIPSLLDHTMGVKAGERKEAGANSNCSLIGVSPRRRLGVCLLLLLFSCMISTRRRLTFWPMLRGSKWLSKQSCHVPS